MDLSMYLGLSQSLLAFVVLLMKKPLKIADIILSLFMLSFALLFGLDVLQSQGLLPDNRWGISISLTMVFAPLLFLYSKYVTKDYEGFKRSDFLHAIPPLLFLFIYLIVRSISYGFKSTGDSVNNLAWIRALFGNIYIGLFILYSIFAIKNVVQFKKERKHFYSYKSDKISLNWLLFVIVSFIVVFLVVILLSILLEYQVLQQNVEAYMHVVELFFVYIISIWGFRQTQLDVEIKTKNAFRAKEIKLDHSNEKYQKSGLKPEQAKKYLNALIQHMEKSEPWKDHELSLDKLAAQTNISKHYITEVLNELVGKNFYLFVNEYRIEYAKKLLSSAKFDHWSVVSIAYECGFNSKTAFYNFFKKITQKTPNDFKKESINI